MPSQHHDNDAVRRASNDVTTVGARAVKLRKGVVLSVVMALIAAGMAVGLGGNASAGSTFNLFAASVKPAQDTDTAAVELGVRFTTNAPGQVTALRYYRTKGAQGTHVGHLWANDGTLLASATFTGTTTGWQSATLSDPVTLTRGTPYIVSYFAPNGRYAVTDDYFQSTGHTSGPLVAFQNGVWGGNGLYTYDSSPQFPVSTYRASNYYADITFTTDETDTTPTDPPASSSTAAPASSTTAAPATTTSTTGALPTTTSTTTSPPPVATSAVPAPATGGRTWVQTFGDEFNGSNLDTSKWAGCADWNNGSDCTGSWNAGLEWYNPCQVVLNNGVARLIAAPLAKANCTNRFNPSYLAGMITTGRGNVGAPRKYSFTYGYVEANLKMPETTGFYGSFWLLPDTPDGSYDYRSEIDVLETLGYDTHTRYMTYHYNNRSQSWDVMNDGIGGDNGLCSTQDYSGAYHRYGLDWEPTYIAWYIDGVKCGQFNGTPGPTSIENGPMWILLNPQVNMSWEVQTGHTADTTLTREMDVDYVRVYQQR